ncbi:MAG: DUF4160 domain-containing protein [Treponema sp.]|nr:DUF4160 domain-containing protein [Treponema sp.]MEE3434039.1 DUF4160 domain-containing protein [Treponema sp.]
MPNILRIGSYYVYFWMNENSEPIHVHVNKGSPDINSTKLWLTKAGGCIEANNNSRIPQTKLNKIKEIVSDNHFYICKKWIEIFGKESLKFYC